MTLAGRSFVFFTLASFCAMALSMAGWPFPVHATTPHNIKVYKIKPSSIDPRVKYDDFDNWVMIDPAAPAAAPLVLWLPGTHGKPGSHGDRPLMDLIVEQGYRLIWLSYDNDISVSKLCPHTLDPGCSAAFRNMRVYGTGTGKSPVWNSPDESIVSRLTHLLTALEKAHPNEKWGQYLEHGKPNWQRIVVAGHSSGAGMAALIAKKHKVARVVLFSSPWDDWHPAGHKRQTAAWLSWPSATPMNRWYAEYQKHEDTADLIENAYRALKIPPSHVFVFALNLPPGFRQHHHHNPYHTATDRDVRYAPTWKVMFGKASGLTPRTGQ